MSLRIKNFLLLGQMNSLTWVFTLVHKRKQEVTSLGKSLKESSSRGSKHMSSLWSLFKKSSAI